MAHNQVSFIRKTTIISTKPVPPLKSIPLSVLDRVMEHKHLRIVMYYQSSSSSSEEEAGEMTRKLRESLSEVLSSFHVITGRLLRNVDGQWMVKCNDAGVRMVEARAKGSLDEWLNEVDRESEHELVHWEEMGDNPYFWSTFYVQITEFEEGGLSIGLSCTHLLADPICATMFIKAWADTTLLGGKMQSPPLFHPLPPRRPFNTNINHKSYTDIINHYKSLAKKMKPLSSLKHTTLTLEFSHEMIQSCMAMARAQGAHEGLTLTPFQALAALFWVCISKVNGRKYGLTNMSLCLDMRKILGLDKGFFGNCMVHIKVQEESLEAQNEALLSKATNAIKDRVEKMHSDHIMDLIEWLRMNDRNHDQGLTMINGHDHLICANLEDVGPYEAIFESGFKPIRASYYIEPVGNGGQVLVLPSPAGEDIFSRVVMVTLHVDEIAKLLEDNFLLQFSPTILMRNQMNMVK